MSVFGQVDSPESPKTPEITEMTENFTKVTKYLTKSKQTTNCGWENLTSKGSKYKIFCEFRVFEYPIWRKMKTQKCRKSTESFLNKKITHCERLPLPENC